MKTISLTVFVNLTQFREKALARGDAAAVASCSILEKMEQVILPASKIKLMLNAAPAMAENPDFTDEANLKHFTTLIPAALPNLLVKMSQTVAILEDYIKASGGVCEAARACEHMKAERFLKNAQFFMQDLADKGCKTVKHLASNLISTVEAKMLVDFAPFWTATDTPDEKLVESKLAKHTFRKVLAAAGTALKAGASHIDNLKTHTSNEGEYSPVSASLTVLCAKVTTLTQACFVASYFKKLNKVQTAAQKQEIEAECLKIIRESKQTLDAGLAKVLHAKAQ